MYEQQPDFGSLIMYFLCFIAAVFIIRWIFRIDRILANLDKNYEINKLIAQKLGVEDIDIARIDDLTEYKRLKIIEEDNETDE